MGSLRQNKVSRFLKSRKGQAAIEYLMVFGLALILSTPFIMKAQGSIADIRSGSEVIELQNSLDKIESSVKTVNAAGDPAKRTFLVSIPNNVDSAELNQNSIAYTLNTHEGNSQMVRTFEANLTGDIPRESGRHKVSVSATENGVQIEVVS